MTSNPATHIFEVPNNDEGKLFLRLARKFRAPRTGISIRSRGRAKDRKAAWEKFNPQLNTRYNRQTHVPHETAERFAVYIRDEKADRRRSLRQSEVIWHVQQNVKRRIATQLLSDADQPLVRARAA